MKIGAFVNSYEFECVFTVLFLGLKHFDVSIEQNLKRQVRELKIPSKVYSVQDMSVLLGWIHL